MYLIKSHASVNALKRKLVMDTTSILMKILVNVNVVQYLNAREPRCLIKVNAFVNVQKN